MDHSRPGTFREAHSLDNNRVWLRAKRNPAHALIRRSVDGPRRRKWPATLMHTDRKDCRRVGKADIREVVDSAEFLHLPDVSSIRCPEDDSTDHLVSVLIADCKAQVLISE